MHSKDNDSVGQLRYAHKERKNIRLYIEAQSTTKDYMSAEGDFHKNIYS